MKRDVVAYMRYYNNERLHCDNGDEAPAQYEKEYYRVAQNDERFASEPFIGVGSLQAQRVS